MIENMLNHKNIEVKLNLDYKNLKGNFKRTFYSGAIDEYFDYKFGKLPYRSLEFDIQTLDKEYYQTAAMVNYPNNFDFTRITEHKYFLDEKSNKTVISVEYPKPYDGTNERFYPIENDKNLSLYEKYKKEADKIKNLYFIGRLGDYKYYNMDTLTRRILDFYKKEFEQ